MNIYVNEDIVGCGIGCGLMLGRLERFLGCLGLFRARHSGNVGLVLELAMNLFSSLRFTDL